ncbi:MAG: succinate dehydrogenase/fumarate reductase iron-sulfur subunit [Candidatus Bipolaricaulia bacterium]
MAEAEPKKQKKKAKRQTGKADDAGLTARFKVYRYRSDGDGRGRYDDFEIALEPRMTVLDGLDVIKWHHDGTLTYRHSCHHAVCGSCAMRINGHHKLACKVKITDQLEKFDEVLVEPMGNMPVIKDLVTDTSVHWDHDNKVIPWLRPTGEPPEQEWQVSPEERVRLDDVLNCIQCGACVATCESLEMDPEFLGPAALARANRFVFDSRDGTAEERLKFLNEPHGIWDCTHCFECIEVCPADVKPMDAIMELREETVRRGKIKNTGTRHIEAFTRDVIKAGWIDEMTLASRSIGWLNLREQIHLIPLGLRVTRSGKMPWGRLFKSLPGADQVGRIYRRVIQRQEQEQE